MTAEQRFERHLPAVLEDLYLGPTPDYRDEVMAVAVRRRQRPSWTFPGRWLPMADIASRPAFALRLPWRTIGVVLVLIALLIGLVVAVVGSRQQRVPSPFGPARNGQVVYAYGGDIFAADPVSGTTRAIVTGPEIDGNPWFSRDGTKVAFMRRVGTGPDAFRLMVAEADGSAVRSLTSTPLDTDGPYEWSPDGSFLVVTDSLFRVYRVEADGSKPPTFLRDNAFIQIGEFRPPNGNEILFEPVTLHGELWVMKADGTGAHMIHAIPENQLRDGDYGSVRYSPDGTKIAFLQAPPGDTNQLRVFVMNADGTGVRQLSTEPGTLVETDLAWSPGGTSIAYDRWRQDQTTLDWLIQPLAIVSVDGGEVRSIGPTPVDNGAWFDFSPDGTSILSMPATPLDPANPQDPVDATSIDLATGQTRTLDWNIGSVMTWQRLALEP